jgi:hypothetical protein
MICRIRWGCTTVPRGIAEPAGGDDVVDAIATAVLAGDEVLGCALEARSVAVGEGNSD